MDVQVDMNLQVDMDVQVDTNVQVDMDVQVDKAGDHCTRVGLHFVVDQPALS